LLLAAGCFLASAHDAVMEIPTLHMIHDYSYRLMT
jgi:hypothetical protein